MKLTPLDIHHKEFRRSIRGYNEEEVDVFLDQVAEEFERFFKENIELNEQVEGMRDKVKQYEGAEQTLQKALLTGQRAADQIQETALHESQTIISDAEAQALKIIQDVQSEKKRVIIELQRLKDSEVRFREHFQEVLGRFMIEADELKLDDVPREVERELQAVQTQTEIEPQADDAEAEPEIEPEIEPRRIEEPSEPTMPDEQNDAAAASDSQAPPVVQAPPVTSDVQIPPVAFDANPPSMADESQTGSTLLDDEPTETESTDATPYEPIFDISQGSIVNNPTETMEPVDETPGYFGSIAGAVPTTQEPGVEPSPVEPVREAAVPGSGGGYFDDFPGQAESLNDSPEPGFKITLGEPIHEVDPPATDPLQNDVLDDLQNQQAPQFDPGNPSQVKGDSTDTAPSDVVSSFFDDDMGSDDD